jgi:hypothetical protein
MTLAQKAFGKSGADLLPFIKSFDGDLPGLIKKAKELGITMTDEDAAAADQFGDQLDTLTGQIKNTTFSFGKELMPVFLDGSKALSVIGWLKTRTRSSTGARRQRTPCEALRSGGKTPPMPLKNISAGWDV